MINVITHLTRCSLSFRTARWCRAGKSKCQEESMGNILARIACGRVNIFNKIRISGDVYYAVSYVFLSGSWCWEEEGER